MTTMLKWQGNKRLWGVMVGIALSTLLTASLVGLWRGSKAQPFGGLLLSGKSWTPLRSPSGTITPNSSSLASKSIGDGSTSGSARSLPPAWQLLVLSMEPMEPADDGQSEAFDRLFKVTLRSANVPKPDVESPVLFKPVIVKAREALLSASLQNSCVALLTAEVGSPQRLTSDAHDAKARWVIRFKERTGESLTIPTEFYSPPVLVKGPAWSTSGAFSYVTRQDTPEVRSNLTVLSVAPHRPPLTQSNIAIEKGQLWGLGEAAWNPRKPLLAAYEASLSEVKHEVRLWDNRLIASIPDGKFPVWSPDGDLLGFVLTTVGDEITDINEPFDETVCVCAADGTHLRRLLTLKSTCIQPICFLDHPYRIICIAENVRASSESSYQLWEMQVETQKARRLGVARYITKDLVDLSPDHKRFVLVEYHLQQGDRQHDTIIGLDVDKQILKTIAVIPTEWGHVNKVKWTPDGSAIVARTSKDKLWYISGAGESHLLVDACDFGFW